MKIEIKQPFRDINNFSKEYSVGEIVDFEKERAEYIISMQLGVSAEPTKKRQTKKELQ